MPELSTNPLKRIFQGIEYISKLPFFKFSSMTGIPFSIPNTFYIEVTIKCNLKCPFCYLNSSIISNTQLELKDIYFVIEEISKWGVKQLTLSGGEPLIYPHLLDIIRYAKDKGLYVGFSTNGTLLTEEIAKELVKSRVDRVAISIDGLQSIHDELRGNGTLEKALKGLELLNKYGERNKKIWTGINTIVLKNNFLHLEEIFFLAKSLNVYFNIMPLNPNINALDYPQLMSDEIRKKLLLKKEDIPQLKHILKRLKRLKRRYGVLIAPDSFLNHLIKYYESGYISNYHCMAGILTYGLRIDGSFIYCDSSYIGKIGNFYQNGIREIWFSKEAKSAREKVRNCKLCLYNCHYSPTVFDLLKDFIFFPVIRKLLY